MDKVFCVEGLPTTSGNYSESDFLLFFTVYGNYSLGVFRENMFGDHYFYPATIDSRPYSVKEVVWYTVLDRNGEVGRELAVPLSIK